MTVTELIALVDRLRAMPSETEWVEFKRDNANPQTIGVNLSALSNEAALRSEARGYLVFGIDDASHAVVGTRLDPYTHKGKGNQLLMLWLGALLQPPVAIEPFVVDHPKGRVVILAVEAARDQPTTFEGSGYCRVGSSTTKLANQPTKERALWTRGEDWSAEICPLASLDDLDPQAIVTAREQFRVKHPTQALELTTWDDETFLNKARLLKRGAITRTALLLLGKRESATLLAPAVARISWILKDAENRELDYAHFEPPFLLVGDRLVQRLRNLTIRALPSGTLFPQELTQYDQWVLREALHNSIAHQDYRRQERVVVVEFPDRVLLRNAGAFIPGTVQTVIEQDAPQLRYRNPFLTQAMVELNLIDTQGGGIKRMFETQRSRSFPMPDYDLSKPDEVSVSIPGRILDERYTRLLMQQPKLTLPQVILLDQVQKRRRIERNSFRMLKDAGLVEGRYPNAIVAGAVAREIGDEARHIRERGFNKKYYMDMILALVREHGPVDRSAVDDLLVGKLPERMTAEQKRSKVRNLLQELRREGHIANQGTRAAPRWVVIGAPKGGHAQ